jgi:hypothetical protein
VNGLLPSSYRFHKKSSSHKYLCSKNWCIMYFLETYVDDLIFVSNQVSFLDSIKSLCLGNLKWMILKKLNIILVYKSSTTKTIKLHLSWEKYLNDVLTKYNIDMSSSRHTISFWY